MRLMHGKIQEERFFLFLIHKGFGLICKNPGHLLIIPPGGLSAGHMANAAYSVNDRTGMLRICAITQELGVRQTCWQIPHQGLKGGTAFLAGLLLLVFMMAL